MGFLLKTAFWLSIVILLLPVPESEQNASTPMVSTGEALSVFTAAINDARGFCTRNPEACGTGAAALQSFGTRAQYASKKLHELISEKLEETKDLVPPPGSRVQPRQIRAGQDTLNAQDLEPPFRDPRPAARRI